MTVMTMMTVFLGYPQHRGSRNGTVITVIIVTGEGQQPGIGGAPGGKPQAAGREHLVVMLYQAAGELVGLHAVNACCSQQLGGGALPDGLPGQKVGVDDRELVELLARREERGADELLRCYGPMLRYPDCQMLP